ncbi:kinase [Pseudoalteromonas piscicida]|uniref:kinase n=1 Tax=Pseudoalteromonas piscicida TaxID=43662 RepID=UPI001F5B3385|nr:kinase [Pseudoalteromonas piscicida]
MSINTELIDKLSAQVKKKQTAQEPLLVGVSGVQGAGKSTLSQQLSKRLQQDGISCECVSLDDFYLDPQARAQLAEQYHPLFKQRGLPGTHDLALLDTVLTQLRAGKAFSLPVFDKSIDKKLPPSQWRKVEAELSVLILEGWCLGIGAQPASLLTQPVNAYERQQDKDASFRKVVNQFLQQYYQPRFAQIDYLVYLNGMDFDRVFRWRLEQEHQLIKTRGRGMSDEQVKQFIQPFQRLSEWGMQYLADAADTLVCLGEAREVVNVKHRAAD